MSKEKRTSFGKHGGRPGGRPSTLNMNDRLRVQVPYRSLLEATVSQRQLHDPARACGEEAGGTLQHLNASESP